VLFANGKQVMDAVDSVRVGARAGLLPFAQDKVTADYNQRAIDAYNKGDMDGAMYHINNSLRLHPAQPEMIRLREKITGERARVNEKSLMERVMHKELTQTTGDAPKGSAMASPMMPAPSMMRDYGATSSSRSYTSASTGSSWSSNEPSSNKSMTSADSSAGQSMPEGSAKNMSSASWDPSQTIWQGEFTPSDSTSSMSPAQRQFYQNYLNGLFVALGMPDIASAFQTDGQGNSEFFATFPESRDMTMSSPRQ
jgi:hypothetical protein